MERSENVLNGTADMNANRKSDVSIVPAKRANKTRTLAAEPVEEREAPKGNAIQQASSRTLSLITVSQSVEPCTASKM